MIGKHSKDVFREEPFFINKITEKIRSSPLLYRLAKGTFWSLVGTIVMRAFSMATTIAIARILGKEDYGAYGMVQSTLGMFGVFAGFAMGSTMTKYVAELKQKDPERAGRILSLNRMVSLLNGGLVGIIVIIAAGRLADETLKRPDLAPIIVTGALLLFVSTQNNVQAGALSGFEAFRTIAKIDLVQALFTPAVSVPLVYFYGIQGGILALIVVSVLGYFLGAIALKRECIRYGIRPPCFDRHSICEWPVLWKFSFPALMAAFFVIPVTWATNAILVNQKNGYAEMGLFNAANQWRQLVIFIPQVLASVMLPIFSEAYGREDKKDFLKTFLMNLRMTWAIALPITILVIACRDILSGFYGVQYIGTARIITILIATSFLNIVNNVVGTALTAAGWMWTGAAFNLAWAIVLVVATLVFVPLYGGFGLAYAYLTAYLFHTIWQMAWVEMKLSRSLILSNPGLILATVVSLLPVLLLDITSFLPYVLLVVIASFPLYSLAVKSYMSPS